MPQNKSTQIVVFPNLPTGWRVVAVNGFGDHLNLGEYDTEVAAQVVRVVIEQALNEDFRTVTEEGAPPDLPETDWEKRRRELAPSTLNADSGQTPESS